MPLYSLQCPDCLDKSQHLMGSNDSHILVKCPSCARKLDRTKHRDYRADMPQIQGDTVAGGCTYDYYDENLGVHIKNKQHRKDEMKKQGLVPYSPDPDMKRFRDENRYIKQNSAPGDADAAKSIAANNKAAGKLRTKKNVRNYVNSVI